MAGFSCSCQSVSQSLIQGDAMKAEGFWALPEDGANGQGSSAGSVHPATDGTASQNTSLPAGEEQLSLQHSFLLIFGREKGQSLPILLRTFLVDQNVGLNYLDG